MHWIKNTSKMNSEEWQLLEENERAIIAASQEHVPVSLNRIAEGLGLKVLAATLPPGVSGELRPSQTGHVIRVNRHDSKARQRFTVAHEIAHYLLHKEHIGDGISDDALYRSGLSDWREAQANRLAADIIMPADKVGAAYAREQGQSAEDAIERLAREFNVSKAAMKIRLEQLQGG